MTKVFRVEHKTEGTGPFTTNTGWFDNDLHCFKQPDNLDPLDEGDWPVLRPQELPQCREMFRAHQQLREAFGVQDVRYGFTSLEQLQRYFPQVHSAHHPDYHIAIYEVSEILADDWQCAFRWRDATRLAEVITFGELA